MAATVTWSAPGIGLQFREVDVVGDSSYPTGGYAVAVSQSGFNHVVGVIVMHSPAGYCLEWDSVNSKVKFYRVNTTGAAQAEVPAATNVTGVTAKLLVLGY